MSQLDEFERGFSGAEEAQSAAEKFGRRYSDIKDQLATAITEFALVKGAVSPKAFTGINKVLGPARRLGLYAGLEKIMPGNLTITKQVHNAVNAVVHELDQADMSAKLSVVKQVAENIQDLFDVKEALSNPGTYFKDIGSNAVETIGKLLGSDKWMHPKKTAKEIIKGGKRMIKKVVNKTAHYSHVPDQDFDIPSGYPKSTGYEGQKVPTLMVHRMILNPFFNETKASDRLDAFMQWLKADRGLSSLNYTMNDIKRYLSDHLEAVAEYCRLQFAIRACQTEQFNNDELKNMLLKELGFDYTTFRDDLAAYQQFIKEMLPTLNAKSLSVFKQLDERIVEMSNYFFTDNRNRYADTVKIFPIWKMVVFRYSNDLGYHYELTDIRRNDTYATFTANWDAIFTRIKHIKAFTDLTSDIRGAFGTSGLTTCLPADWNKPLEQGVADVMLRTQIMNAVDLEYAFNRITAVDLIPEDSEPYASIHELLPLHYDLNSFNVVEGSDESALLVYASNLEHEIPFYPDSDDATLAAVETGYRTAINSPEITSVTHNLQQTDQEVFNVKESPDSSIQVILPTGKQLQPAEALEVIQLIPAKCEIAHTLLAKFEKTEDDGKTIFTDTISGTVRTQLFALAQVEIYGVTYNDDGTQLDSWESNLMETDAATVILDCDNRPSYDRNSYQVPEITTEQVACMVNETPVLHTLKLYIKDTNSEFFDTPLKAESDCSQLVDVQIMGDLSSLGMSIANRATAYSLYWFTTPAEEEIERTKRKNILYALAATLSK
jgi:hypothetical protein